MKFKTALFSAIIISAANTCPAEIYKCVIDGKVNYLDRPCPSNSTTEKIIPSGPSIPVCKGSLDSIAHYMNDNKIKFIDEIKKICPGAYIAKDNTITVISENRKTIFNLNNSNDENLTFDDKNILSENDIFDFDGFKWEILSVKKFRNLGTERNLQKPANGIFIGIEFKVQNTTEKPRYIGNVILIANGTQHPSSSKSVYAENNYGYYDNDSTQFEPKSTLKTYSIFDADFSSEYILVLKERIGDKRAKIKISP